MFYHWKDRIRNELFESNINFKDLILNIIQQILVQGTNPVIRAVCNHNGRKQNKELIRT